MFKLKFSFRDKVILLVSLIGLTGLSCQKIASPNFAPANCVSNQPAVDSQALSYPTTTTTSQETAIVLPIANYFPRRTFKVFGQLVQNRFSGYHTGDYLEVTPEELSLAVPVFILADGRLV